MNKLITEALAKLDHANDNHWTEDGLPRLDTIKILAGDPSITREKVTTAAPDFNRAAAQAAASATPGEGATTPPPPVPPAPPAPPAVPPAAEDPPLTPPPLGEPTSDIADLRKSLDEALANMSDKKDALQKAQQAIVDAQNEVGRIEDEIAKLSKTADNPITSYLARQREVLAERGARKDLIKESGIDLKQLAKDLKSPLDSAMSRKNTRGAMRPPVRR